MTESKRKPLSIKEIYMRTREGMGHTWPVGTFNQGEPIKPDTIEGEYEVLPGKPKRPKRLTPRNPIAQEPNNQSPEVTNG